MLNWWRDHARSEGSELGYVRLIPKDPKRDTSFKGLDRSNIPATIDHHITEGIGMQIFQKAVQNSDKSIRHTVGIRTEEAFMSFGRAVAMFGQPEEPGADYDRSSSSGTTTNDGITTPSTQDDSIEKVMSECSIAPDSRAQARTESDLRQTFGFWGAPTKPLLEGEDRFDLLKPGVWWATSLGLLANDYAKKAREKLDEEKSRDEEAESAATENGQAREVASEETASDEADSEDCAVFPTDANGWPQVEGLDWDGYTNYAYRCVEADGNFQRGIIDPWKFQRNAQLDKIEKKIRAWEPPATDTSKQIDSRKYYNGENSLLQLDAKRLGIKLEAVVPSR